MESRTLAPNVRAAVSTAVCTLLAVAAHRSMAGAGIPPAAMVLGAALVFCFARIAAALGERGLGTIGLLVGGSQVGLHLLFQAAQATNAPARTMSMPPMPGMTAMRSMPDMAHVSDMASGMTTHGITTPGMTTAHVLAAVATAWWLRRGEAALFAAVARARAVLGASWRLLARWIAGARPVRPEGRATRALGLGVHRPAVAGVLLFAVIRRGPPTEGCALSG